MSNRGERAAALITEWKSIQSGLDRLFRARDQENAKEWMERGITLFMQFLYLTNHQDFSPIEQIRMDEFLYKPVNVEERINFIKSKPGLYHSYRQLAELMVEQEKQFVKSNIIKKSSRL